MLKLKKVVFSVVSTILVVMILLTSTLVVNALTSLKVEDNILLLSEETSIEDGCILDDYTDDVGYKINIDEEKNIENDIIALNLEMYKESSNKEKNYFKELIKDEFEEGKKIILYGNKDIKSDDAFGALDIKPNYSIGSSFDETSNNIGEEGLVGIAVEEKDNFCVVTYFFDEDKYIDKEKDLLSWLTSLSTFDDVKKNYLNSSESSLISTQRRVVGSGSTEVTYTPTIVSNQRNWSAKLYMTLRRTEILYKGTNYPVTKWDATSFLSMIRKNSSTKDQILNVTVAHNHGYVGSRQLIYRSTPSTSLNNKSYEVSISAGVDSTGIANVGSSYSESVTLSDVSVELDQSRIDSDGQIEWIYTYAHNSNAAIKGGFEMVQQTQFYNQDVGDVYFALNFNANFGTINSGSCGNSAETVINDYITGQWYYLSTNDMV